MKSWFNIMVYPKLIIISLFNNTHFDCVNSFYDYHKNHHKIKSGHMGTQITTTMIHEQNSKLSCGC